MSLEEAEGLQGRSVILFIDNVSAISALIKGASKSSDQDTMAQFFQWQCMRRHIYPYFEYIESSSNWSDSLSRRCARWAEQRGFACAAVSWHLSLAEVSSILSARFA